MPPKRMTANPTAPLRYRAGKPLPANDPPSSSEESDSDSDASDNDTAPAAKASARTAPQRPQIGVSSNIAARDAAAAAARKAPPAATGEDDGFVTASDSSDDDGEGAGSEDESGSEDDDEEDYDSSSSGSDARGPRFAAPVFMSKSARARAGNDHGVRDTRRANPEAEEADEAERRREKADAMLAAQLERSARERAAAAREWDDDEGGAGLAEDDVDDTDGLDPAAEHAAWRLRELKRVKREREAIEVAEAERAEVERRRNLSAEERKREDDEHIAKQKEEKDGRGKAAFMQQYFHKGAFFQGDGEEDEAVKEAMTRDIMGRQFEGHGDREVLPEYMQIRDMTKLGKKSRTRYKDLKSEDTGSFGRDLYDKGRGRGDAGRRYDDGPSGANNVAVGERRRRDGDGDRGDEKRPRHDGR